MDWETFVVTVALVTVLLFCILLALLSRIWEDRSPHARGAEREAPQADESSSVEVKKAMTRKESLAS